MFLKYNNLSFLKKDSINKPPSKVLIDIEQGEGESLISAYEEINDQIIEEFGVDESFLAHKKTQEEIAKLKLDFIISGNKMKRTAWRLKELDIKEPGEEVEMTLSREISIVSKNLGVGIIDIKGYTIFQYLTAKKHN